MAKKKNKPEENLASPEQIQQVETYKDAEWVFQFDTEDPIVFAWSSGDSEEPGEVNIKLKSSSNSSIFFSSAGGNKTFRMYSRPISDETRKIRSSSKK